MFNQLDFSVTYATITPESAEYGDFEDTGFYAENIGFDTFAELVDYLERNGYNYWSDSRGTGWLSTGFSVEGYATGEEIEYSIHANNTRSQRYLEKAFMFTNK